ncbi:hypothetical protein [Reinekea sp. G2M2-21]|uniref:hypothetical protein n=1 Tax=Reinekea sp. G2M2-21 TaxID=2788942 RepID=UPI0018ABC0A6|nr:hypothetical protein [Reinekea sp. G2M2-21]
MASDFKLIERNYFSTVSKVLIILISILSIIASYIGIFSKNIYFDLVDAGKLSQKLAYGSVGQDIVILPVSVVLLIIGFYLLRKDSIKLFLVALGLVWCNFYAFGLYTIQGQYTSIYIIYLLIFSFSIFSIVFGLISILNLELVVIEKSKVISKVVCMFLLLIIFLLSTIWLLQLFQGMRSNTQPDIYGVFIMDLGIVFPSMFIICILLLRKNKSGYLLSIMALIKAFALCLSWAFGEFYIAFVQKQDIAVDMFSLAASFSFICLILSSLMIRKVDFKSTI